MNAKEVLYMKYEAPICEWFEIKAADVICASGNLGGLEPFPEGSGGDTPGQDTDLV